MTPFSVIPYWSLAYEFWFYLLLAATLMQPGRRRTLCVTAIFLIMGQRIWVLLPCWLLGVWAYRLTQSSDQGLSTRSTLPHARLWASLLFMAGVALWVGSGADGTLRAATEALDNSLQALAGKEMRLNYSRWFLSDYGVALLFFGALILAARDASAPSGSLLARAIKWLAPHTFGLYLLHYTLISLSAALIPSASRSGLHSCLLAAVIIGVCIALSVVFDRSRSLWTRFFLRLAALLPGEQDGRTANDAR